MKGKERTLIEFAARLNGVDPDLLFRRYNEVVDITKFREKRIWYDFGFIVKNVNTKEELRLLLIEKGLFSISIYKGSITDMIRKVNKLHFKLNKIL